VALDAAGPIAVLALSGDGRVLITGSSARPVIHVWSVQKGLGRRGPATAKRQPPMVLLGTLVSALHAGACQSDRLSQPPASTCTGPVHAFTSYILHALNKHAPTHPLTQLFAGSITNVALSAKYGIVVSVCSHNRVALLWDLNRRRLVRQLALSTTSRAATDSGNDLVTVSIDETTGTIVVTAGTTIHAYDANGSPLATLDASALPLRESLAATGGADASTSTSASGAGVVVSTVNVLKALATPISACCVVGDGCVFFYLLFCSFGRQVEMARSTQWGV
jgi:WD40 repeat protein